MAGSDVFMLVDRGNGRRTQAPRLVGQEAKAQHTHAHGESGGPALEHLAGVAIRRHCTAWFDASTGANMPTSDAVPPVELDPGAPDPVLLLATRRAATVRIQAVPRG